MRKELKETASNKRLTKRLSAQTSKSVLNEKKRRQDVIESMLQQTALLSPVPEYKSRRPVLALNDNMNFIPEKRVEQLRNNIKARKKYNTELRIKIKQHTRVIKRMKRKNTKFQKKGLKLTDQRRTIAKVILESKEAYGESDHPDVDELYNRVSKIDTKISIATVYRTVKLFEEAGILTKHDFKTGKARYELNDDHNHLIDIKSGEIIEFVDEEIDKLQKKVAEKYGYTLVDHKLELYGIKKKS